MRSFYYGSRTLEHGTIELDADGVTNSFTGHCHVFNEEGNHEITTLDNDQAVNLLKFVANYANVPIKVVLKGTKNYAYTLPDKDKAALTETLRLQILMEDIKKLEAQHRQASLQVEKYKKRLEK